MKYAITICGLLLSITPLSMHAMLSRTALSRFNPTQGATIFAGLKNTTFPTTIINKRFCGSNAIDNHQTGNGPQPSLDYNEIQSTLKSANIFFTNYNKTQDRGYFFEGHSYLALICGATVMHQLIKANDNLRETKKELAFANRNLQSIQDDIKSLHKDQGSLSNQILASLQKKC